MMTDALLLCFYVPSWTSCHSSKRTAYAGDMVLFKQVEMDGKEGQVCRVCLAAMAHLVWRETVALMVSQAREVHRVSWRCFVCDTARNIDKRRQFPVNNTRPPTVKLSRW